MMVLGEPNTMSRVSYAVFLLFLPGSAFAQTAPPLSFEVASVKPANPQFKSIGIHNYAGGRISVSYLTLEMLISEAFDVPLIQLSGGPAWIRKDRYDIEARPPASSRVSKLNPRHRGTPLSADQRQLLQGLLADRFQLKVHRETRQGRVYFLVKGDTGLKLESPKDPNSLSWAGSFEGGPIIGDGIAGINISMRELAVRLGESLGCPVLDRTGLKGSYDFKFQDATAPAVTPAMGDDDAIPTQSERPDSGADDPEALLRFSILMSVKGIGLRLDQGKGPVETVVIDRAEKPSEN